MATRAGKGGQDRDADIFISYQRDTADKAKKLAEALRKLQQADGAITKHSAHSKKESSSR